MGFSYKFSVVKGIQAKREYYITMVPLNILSKLFNDNSEVLLPEYRAQRVINESRIPVICDYIILNRENYVFSALSASIDGNIRFIPSDIDSNIGILEVDMNSIFMMNDGQHRKAAIEKALIEDRSLENETISIVLFKDDGLKRSQQMFADLNKHAVKSTVSLSTLYDDRDEFANIVKDIVKRNSFLSKFVDKENDNLGKNSSKLFTLSNFVRANKRIIKTNSINEEEKAFLYSFWNKITTRINEYVELENNKIHKCQFKSNYILNLSVTLQAFGRLGRTIFDNNCIDKLDGLSKIEWYRENSSWQNRIINNQGKIISKEIAIIKLCNYIKKELGINLTKEEEIKEHELL